MKALTIGGAMVDTIAIIRSEQIERMEMRNADISFLLLEEGRKTEATDISTHCGGGAVNAAVAMARLGHDVSTLIKLGQDDRADIVLSKLSDEGVSSRWAIRDAAAPTGASVMVASHDRNAAIFTFRGANTLLKPSDLRKDAFAVDLVYATGLSNESADCFPDIVAAAKAQGAKIAVNPGIRQLSARHDAFHGCLASIDMLAINRVEADTLVPTLISRFGEGGPALPLELDEMPPALVGRGLEGGGFQMTLAGFFTALLELGVGVIVVTDGRDGAYLGSADGIHHCPVAPADVVGTAGAGDAFSSTLAAGLADGLDAATALKRASLNAASVIGHIDTQTGLLTNEALDGRVAEHDGDLIVRHWPI